MTATDRCAFCCVACQFYLALLCCVSVQSVKLCCCAAFPPLKIQMAINHFLDTSCCFIPHRFHLPLPHPFAPATSLQQTIDARLVNELLQPHTTTAPVVTARITNQHDLSHNLRRRPQNTHQAIKLLLWTPQESSAALPNSSLATPTQHSGRQHCRIERACSPKVSIQTQSIASTPPPSPPSPPSPSLAAEL